MNLLFVFEVVLFSGVDANSSLLLDEAFGERRSVEGEGG